MPELPITTQFNVLLGNWSVFGSFASGFKGIIFDRRRQQTDNKWSQVDGWKKKKLQESRVDIGKQMMQDFSRAGTSSGKCSVLTGAEGSTGRDTHHGDF